MQKRITKIGLGLFTLFAMVFGSSVSQAVEAEDMKPGAPGIILPRLSVLNDIGAQGSKLGIERACVAQVKDLSGTLLNSLSANQAEVQRLASARNIDLNEVFWPKKEGMKVEDFIRRLSHLNQMTDCLIDKPLLKLLKKYHIFELKLLDRSIKTAKDPEVRRFLYETKMLIKGQLKQIIHLLKVLENQNGVSEQMAS